LSLSRLVTAIPHGPHRANSRRYPDEEFSPRPARDLTEAGPGYRADQLGLWALWQAAHELEILENALATPSLSSFFAEALSFFALSEYESATQINFFMSKLLIKRRNKARKRPCTSLSRNHIGIPVLLTSFSNINDIHS
jgi:hypothetical protein